MKTKRFLNFLMLLFFFSPLLSMVDQPISIQQTHYKEPFPSSPLYPIPKKGLKRYNSNELLMRLRGGHLRRNSIYRNCLYVFMRDFDRYSKQEQTAIISKALGLGKSSRIIMSGAAEAAIISAAALLLTGVIAIPVANTVASALGASGLAAMILKLSSMAISSYFWPLLILPLPTALAIISKIDRNNRIYTKEHKTAQRSLVDLAIFLHRNGDTKSAKKIFSEILGPDGLQKRIPGSARFSMTYILMLNKVKEKIILKIPDEFKEKLTPQIQSFLDSAALKETKMRKGGIRKRLKRGGTESNKLIKKAIPVIRDAEKAVTNIVKKNRISNQKMMGNIEDQKTMESLVGVSNKSDFPEIPLSSLMSLEEIVQFLQTKGFPNLKYRSIIDYKPKTILEKLKNKNHLEYEEGVRRFTEQFHTYSPNERKKFVQTLTTHGHRPLRRLVTLFSCANALHKAGYAEGNQIMHRIFTRHISSFPRSGKFIMHLNRQTLPFLRSMPMEMRKPASSFVQHLIDRAKQRETKKHRKQLYWNQRGLSTLEQITGLLQYEGFENVIYDPQITK